MKQPVLLAVILIAAGAGGANAQGDHATTAVRPSDVAMAQILDSLSHPTSAKAQAKIPSGEVTRCESYTQGNHTVSDCSPHTRFEEIHQLILLFCSQWTIG